jgi:signal transduction histidine kinase
VLARRLTGRQRAGLDALLAALLAGTSVPVILAGTSVPATSRDLGTGGPHGQALIILSYLAVGAASLPLPARRRYPKAVLSVILAAGAVLIALSIRLPAELAAGFAIYTLAATAASPLPARAVVTAIGVLTACGLAAWDSEAMFAAILASGSLLVGWLAGENSRARRSFALALAARAAERERERYRRTAVEEKARIARELHDVVAHAMSVIAVRSGVARLISRTQPDEAAEALGIIETISRRALGELRSLVTVLRQEEQHEHGESHPAPGLADIPELAAEIGAAGVRVDLRVEGTACPLPPTQDVSGYRIAQEALTNVVRHSAADTATLWIRYRPGTVEIECVDPGGQRPARPAAQIVNGEPARARPTPREGELMHGGHGIAGMRERVAIYGGEFSALPSGPGFRVMARLPVPTAGR